MVLRWCGGPHRCRTRGGGGLADRVGPSRRRAHQDGRRRRPRRGVHPGRPGHRPGEVARGGGAPQTRGLADHRRPAPRPRPVAARRTLPVAHGGAGPGDRRARRAGRVRRRPGGGLRRRPPQAHVRVLSPGTVHPGADRAHPAAARRTHHGRDRPRLPRARVHRRPARGAGQTHARPEGGSVRGAERPGPRRSTQRRPRGPVPGVQRGVHGDLGRALAASRTV